MDGYGFGSNQRDLRLTRLYYALFLGGGGFIIPFLNLFYVRIGLSGTAIGWVTSVGAMVALVAAPAWTSRVRQSRWPREMLQLSLLMAAVGYLWLAQQRLLAWILIVSAIRSLVSPAIGPLSDALALSVTGATRSGFGSVRVWGSIGWVVFVLAGGWLFQQYGAGPNFIGAFTTTLLAGALLLFIRRGHFLTRVTSGQVKRRMGSAIHTVLTRKAMLGVAIMMSIIGFANSGVNQFELVYLDKLGAAGSVIGVAGMISAVVEIPCMFWADHLVTKKGPHLLLMLSMLGWAVLRGSIYLFPSVPSILLQRGLAGISFSFYTVALVKFISQQTEPEERSTMLALFTVTLVNLISIISSPVAGKAYDVLGARWLYPIAAAGYLAGWLILKITHQKEPPAETLA